nr:MAG TPA: hypothetical protein [Caudoviricetes sp.]
MLFTTIHPPTFFSFQPLDSSSDRDACCDKIKENLI